MTNEQLIDQSGHRLGVLYRSPAYANEINKLIQIAKNEAYWEARNLRVEAYNVFGLGVQGPVGETLDVIEWYDASITALIKEI